MTYTTTPRETAKTIAAWWTELHGQLPDPASGIELIARLFKAISEAENDADLLNRSADAFIGIVAFSSLSTPALAEGAVDKALFGIIEQTTPNVKPGLTYDQIGGPVAKMAAVINAEATLYATTRSFGGLPELRKQLAVHTTQFIGTVVMALIGFCKTAGGDLDAAVQARMAENRKNTEIPL